MLCLITGIIWWPHKNKAGVYYNARLETYDASTGTRLTERSFQNLNRGEKLISMNYDIHTGAVLGIWGKILVFTGGLMAAGLPLRFIAVR